MNNNISRTIIISVFIISLTILVSLGAFRCSCDKGNYKIGCGVEKTK